ncbi:SRPBCC family protein [Gemmatimonas aurantiaca]|uniref:SRPBCC family protein n=1 Tax=Gemmatimonas aurantiaca TaxID=173480 RepID=UPI00301BD8D4
MSNANRIEKRVTLNAPVSRVWRALTDTREFGEWFGIRLTGAFVVGQTVSGTFDERLSADAVLEFQESLGLTPSPVDIPEAPTVFCTVQAIEPEHYFSFRWVPFGIDAGVDPATEPTTLVEFTLEPVVGGTQLTIVESGFDQVPAHRRERAFRMNEAGWSGQAENVKRYVEDL